MKSKKDLQKKYDEEFRAQQEKDADLKMENARSVMVMSRAPSHAFFASLIMKMNYKHDWEIEACTTDGRSIRYNPEFMMLMPKETVKAVHAKLVMHAALGHPEMLATHRTLDQDKLKLAMELVVNDLISDAGMKLPSEALLPGKGHFKDIKRNQTTLEMYRQLEDGPSGGADNLSGMGGVSAATGPKGGLPSDSDLEAQSQTWKINTAIADGSARKRGNISANLRLVIDGILKAKVDWRVQLREWATRKVKRDYSWSKVNRRLISQGVYLPSLGGESLTGLIVANDTSGSMSWNDARSQCSAEIQAIAEQLGCNITILHHDCQVCSVQKWSPEDGALRLEPKGGGGTSHVPVFEWIASSPEEEIAGLICLTDMETCFPDNAPDYPVLWAAIGRSRIEAPFGETIYIEEDAK